MICEIRVKDDTSGKLLYYVCRRFDSNWIELYDFAATYAAPLTAAEAKEAISLDKDLLLTVTKKEVDGVAEVLQYAADHNSADTHYFPLDGMNNLAGMWKPADISADDLVDFWNSTDHKPANRDAEPQTCQHVWVEYVGLVESFDYCKLCDVKRTER